jgi:ABC-type nitrate/sulfonate/bicarbonate transport system permease component
MYCAMSRWFLAIRGRVPKKAAVALGLVPIVALIGLWWFVTRGEVEERIYGPQILPSPAEVIQRAPELVTDRHLSDHLFASLRRVGLGFLVATVIVFPLGVLMGSFGTAKAIFGPAATATSYIPIATLVPLTMSWFGIDERQKIYFLAIAFGIYLLPMIVAAVENVPGVYLRTAYTLGATRLQTVLRVLVPISMPEIWHGLRLAFGVGWTYLVLTESLMIEEGSGGLGALIFISQRRGPREHVYLIIIVITLIAWASDTIWAYAGRLLFPYVRTRT